MYDMRNHEHSILVAYMDHNCSVLGGILSVFLKKSDDKVTEIYEPNMRRNLYMKIKLNKRC